MAIEINDSFVSVTEAAAILGCTEGRVRQLLLNDEIPGEKLNKRAWILRRSDVENYEKSSNRGRPRRGV